MNVTPTRPPSETIIRRMIAAPSANESHERRVRRTATGDSVYPQNAAAASWHNAAPSWVTGPDSFLELGRADVSGLDIVGAGIVGGHDGVWMVGMIDGGV